MTTPLDKYYKYYNLSRVSPKLLKNEELANLYIKPKKEKRSEQSKVIVWKPNATHQADLGEMPIDPKGYHYFLVVVEVSKRRVDGELLKNKTAQSVLNAFKRIYKRNRIKPPISRIETDSGKEFDNFQVRDFFLNSIGILMRFGEPGKHRQQCYAEKAIQAIQEPLIQRMNAQELKTGETSIEWSEDFRNIVNKVDENWKCNPPKIPEGFPKINTDTELLFEGTKVRVKLEEPISILGKKLHGKFRTGDIRWDPEIHIIKKLILSPEQPPTYLLNGPYGKLGVSRCAYTRKQLQLVPDHENPPPDSVIRGYPQRYIPEKILNQRIRKGQLQYLVKWERYPINKATWEPADKIQEDVPNLVQEYLNINRV
jgi:Chromo (CHRromatin Organisation MOdifier) domain